MPHHTPLIAILVGGLAIAFVLGAIANRLRVSPIVGYLLAGIAIGPATPGFVADQALATELAEIGIILLMFGVGLHFSVKDLLSVRAIAIPGALVQIGIATLLGMGLAWTLGWSMGGGIVFGLALSVASTVVLLRALQERRLIDSERGRIAVGWLIVEDIAMVLALVLLPALSPLFKNGINAWSGNAGPVDLIATVGVTLGKVAAFFAVMLIVGRRVIPWVLHYIAHTGSRELFRLAVLTIALGVAYGAAQLFGVSFALGAFFAGMILSESPLSQQAARESLPLRDAFAVLFFISVGMLFHPAIVVSHPWALIATIAIIVLGKSLAALLIAMAFRHPLSTAFMISASLAQIGEFSFILAALGVGLGLLPDEGRDLILAGAIISILINPLLFEILDRARPRLERREKADKGIPGVPGPSADYGQTTLAAHAVVVGFGRVGSVIGKALQEAAVPFLVIEEKDDLVQQLHVDRIEVIEANALSSNVLEAANIEGAKCLFVAVPNGFEAVQIVRQARAANPTLLIVARAHSDAEVEQLSKHGADQVVMGEREIAEAMVKHAMAGTLQR